MIILSLKQSLKLLNNKLREKGKLKIFEDDDSKIKITKFNIKYWYGNSRLQFIKWTIPFTLRIFRIKEKLGIEEWN